MLSIEAPALRDYFASRGPGVLAEAVAMAELQDTELYSAAVQAQVTMLRLLGDRP